MLKLIPFWSEPLIERERELHMKQGNLIHLFQHQRSARVEVYNFGCIQISEMERSALFENRMSDICNKLTTTHMFTVFVLLNDELNLKGIVVPTELQFVIYETLLVRMWQCWKFSCKVWHEHDNTYMYISNTCIPDILFRSFLWVFSKKNGT